MLDESVLFLYEDSFDLICNLILWSNLIGLFFNSVPTKRESERISIEGRSNLNKVFPLHRPKIVNPVAQKLWTGHDGLRTTSSCF